MRPDVVIDVSERDFDDRVVEASRRVPVVVDFWAGWCRPCLILSPLLERLAEEHGGRFVLARVDVDANPVLADRFGIQGIPAVKAFRDGAPVWDFVGVQPEDVIRRFLGELLPSEADERVASARSGATPEAAEAAYREALAVEPGHRDAALGLSEILLERGDVDEARALLAPLAPDGDVRGLQAEIELRSAAAGSDELAEVATRALDGRAREALERSLELVAAGGEGRGEARDLMVRIFEVLGEDDPLTREFRPRLAGALF